MVPVVLSATKFTSSKDPDILPAIPISEPASERIKGARLQLASQDVLLVHGQVAANQ